MKKLIALIIAFTAGLKTTAEIVNEARSAEELTEEIKNMNRR